MTRHEVNVKGTMLWVKQNDAGMVWYVFTPYFTSEGLELRHREGLFWMKKGEYIDKNSLFIQVQPQDPVPMEFPLENPESLHMVLADRTDRCPTIEEVGGYF